MKKTATDLRANLYEVLDYVARTGRAVEVTRGGVELCIVRKEQVVKKEKRAAKVLPDLIVGNPDDLVHVEWPWDDGRKP